MSRETHFKNFWVEVIRRTRMAPSTKYVALMLATYANSDGSSVRPSVDRLVAVTCTSKRTVLRALRELRQAELIELTSRAHRTRGLADVYRLAVPDDHIERVRMLPPGEIVPLTQGADVTPDQGADVTPDPESLDPTGDPSVDPHADPSVDPPRRTRSGAKEDGVRCQIDTGQVSQTTDSGATSAPPPVHDHPLTRTNTKGGSEPSHLNGNSVIVAARERLAQLAPDHQQRLLDEAIRRIGADATSTELLCVAADVHHDEQRTGRRRRTPTVDDPWQPPPF